MSNPTGDPDLTVDDVADYTKGRLSAEDDETQRMLDAALAAARHEVGWHVSPVADNQTIIMDGPGGHVLRLPTLKIVELHKVVDGGKTLDLDTEVSKSAQVGWKLTRHRGRWSWRESSITVTLDHGFTSIEAADWRQAILSMVDQMAGLSIAGRPDADLQSKQVDDVVYRWGPQQALPGIAPILDKYRLPFRGFA